MRCVDRWAGVVLTPPWLVVVTLVVVVCTFSKSLKWTLEKVLSAEVGWVDEQGQAVCGLVAPPFLLQHTMGMSHLKILTMSCHFLDRSWIFILLVEPRKASDTLHFFAVCAWSVYGALSNSDCNLNSFLTNTNIMRSRI